MHVAVVEDATDVAMLIEVFLTAGGHTVTRFTNDFESLRDNPVWQTVDTVICDRMLGGFEGENLLMWLEESHPHIRRIMLTGSVNISEADAHAHTVLIKPVSPEVLQRAVQGDG